jgi:tRNA-dihydrouridine synthase A
MMARTDRHARYFHRLLSENARLYTEMIPIFGILNGNTDKLLKYNKEESPVVLQLGGSDPEMLAEAAIIGEEWGYDEINLNIGCPSPRAYQGRIGACLMKEPELIGKCIYRMKSSTRLTVSIKTRIGIDDMDIGKPLDDFIKRTADNGCHTIIIHARKALLKGLNPKENRNIPPLNYNRVYDLKEKFPNLNIIINGGIKNIDECKVHLKYTDGVMLGRVAYDQPYILSYVDKELFGSDKMQITRDVAIKKFKQYCTKENKKGTSLNQMTRHVMGLYHGCTGAKAWRKKIASASDVNSL